MKLVITKFGLNWPISWGVSFDLYCMWIYNKHKTQKPQTFLFVGLFEELCNMYVISMCVLVYSSCGVCVSVWACVYAFVWVCNEHCKKLFVCQSPELWPSWNWLVYPMLYISSLVFPAMHFYIVYFRKLGKETYKIHMLKATFLKCLLYANNLIYTHFELALFSLWISNFIDMSIYIF